MNKLIVRFFLLFLIISPSFAENLKTSAEDLFYIGQMNSHDNNFSLYFKTREKAVLARGENFNYVTDYPQDLYIYDYKKKNFIPINFI